VFSIFQAIAATCGTCPLPMAFNLSARLAIPMPILGVFPLSAGSVFQSSQSNNPFVSRFVQPIGQPMSHSTQSGDKWPSCSPCCASMLARVLWPAAAISPFRFATELNDSSPPTLGVMYLTALGSSSNRTLPSFPDQTTGGVSSFPIPSAWRWPQSISCPACEARQRGALP